MTRVRIAPPDTEEDITAEQVAAYLLGGGWTDISLLPGSPLWRKFLRDISIVDVPLDQGLVDHGAMMAECIKRIARAEQRHPSAVLADIVGPVRAASVGAYCEPWLFVAELRVRLSCKLPACDLMGCSPARGAGEESE